MNAIEHLNETASPVPSYYRGVWKRTLLEAPDLYDASTTVFWMQTSSWHADIRIPANRPDFSAVSGLEGCSAMQRSWLASQQGFAGITEVKHDTRGEICTWHRYLDFQPPSLLPDAGFMRFGDVCLVETGVHADYLENWEKLPGSENGFAVMVRLGEADEPASPIEMILVAGEYVMYVRNRAVPWIQGMSQDVTLQSLVKCHGHSLLDMTISFGKRTAGGWEIQHSLLPWLEDTVMPIKMNLADDKFVVLTSHGRSTHWRILEWSPPRS